MTDFFLIFSSGLAIWILCAGALTCLIVDALWPRKFTAVVYALGILFLCVTLVVAFMQWSNMKHVLSQDILIIDHLTLFFLILVVTAGIFTLFNALGYIKIHHNLTAEFCSLTLFSLIGMIFLFASDHLLVNFIGLELMSLSVYVLTGSHKKNIKSNEAAIKYFVMGSLASAIILYGMALFYGAFATLRLSQIGNMLAAPGLSYLPQIALVLLLVGILFKLAIVPFHFWAPDVYEGAPAPVTGFMATALKIAVFGFAIRVFASITVLDTSRLFGLLNALVVLTLIFANLLALVQDNIKRMLAYSSISHAGFILFGLVIGFVNNTFLPFTLHVVIFYLTGYLFMTLGAFAVLSLFVKENSEADHITDLTGLGHRHPFLAAVFTLFMLSLIGIPGTVGFAAKYNLILIAMQNNYLSLSILAVLVSVISVYYYLKPVIYMFFLPKNSQPSVVQEIPLTICVSLTLCAFLVIYMGLAPDTFIELAKIAAKGLG